MSAIPACTWRSCCSAAPWSASASSQPPESIRVFAVVVEASPPVLVGDRPPAPDRDRLLRHDPVLLERIALLRLDGAAVLPVIAEIEDVLELLARLDLFGDPQLGVVQPDQFGRERVVRVANQPTITQLEGMQMREIPPREPGVDRPSELLKRMRRADQKDPPRRRVAHDPTTTKQVHPDPKPRPRHRPNSLRRL